MQIIEKLKNENDPEAQKALSEISKELLEKISREGLGKVVGFFRQEKPVS